MSDVIPAAFACLLETAALAQVSGFRQKARNREREPRNALSIAESATTSRYLGGCDTVERIEPDPDRA